MGDLPTDRFYVLTGGPCSGKSTLIAALRDAGFQAMPEAGRAIIQQQVAIDGPALPWKDPALFAELGLSWEMRSYREALQLRGPVFFDHSLAGSAGYFRLMGLPVPEHVLAAASTHRYHRRVLLAPPWAEIYENDAERKQTWEEAVATYERVVATYAENGYELVELAKVSVEERVRFVVATLGIGQPDTR
jgi:predicted ATPase